MIAKKRDDDDIDDVDDDDDDEIYNIKLPLKLLLFSLYMIMAYNYAIYACVGA